MVGQQSQSQEKKDIFVRVAAYVCNAAAQALKRT